METPGDPTGGGDVVPGDKPRPDPKTPTNTKNGGGGGTAGDNNKWVDVFKLNYRELFPPGKYPPVPAALLADAKSHGKYTDAQSILDWLMKNREGIYFKTARAKGRATEMNDALGSIFGEDTKVKAAFIKMYVMGDPRVWSLDKFLEKKVVTSKIFKQDHPGWADYFKNRKGENLSYSTLINEYGQRVGTFTQWYKSIMGPEATISQSALSKAVAEGWDKDTFETWIRGNDPNYLGTGGAKNRVTQITNLWNTIFGEDTATGNEFEAAKEKFARSGETLEDFFNNTIRTSDAFKQSQPWFEAWADSSGLGDMPVNPIDFFQTIKEKKEQYELLAETPGAYNEDIVRQAVENNWSNARMELEFIRKDPAYKGTAASVNKQRTFERYWQNLFGTDSKPDATIMKEFMTSMNQDPSAHFDDIKQLPIFQQQYGGWEEFAKAQSEKGNAMEIIDDPAAYKVYERMLDDEFARVGLDATEFKPLLFSSGLEDKDIQQGLSTWVQTRQSQEWQSGQKPTVQQTIGLGGKQEKIAGGDLRIRMEKALEQHKTFANSKFSQFQKQEKPGGLVTTKI